MRRLIRSVCQEKRSSNRRRLKGHTRWPWRTLPLFLYLVGYHALAENTFDDLLRPTFIQNCIKCHGEKGKVKGKVDLSKIKSGEDLSRSPKLMKKLIEALDFGDMPPEKERPLEDSRRKKLVLGLRTMLHAAVDAQKAIPRTPIRRMNRFQYSNAVGDLLDMKVTIFPLPESIMREYGNYFRPDIGKMPGTLRVGNRPLGKSQLIERRLAGVGPFPQDLRAEHGFDNRGDHLSMSPYLMEAFLKLSRSIVDSRDFGPKTCGKWGVLFAQPKDDEKIEAVVRRRLRLFLTRAFRRIVNETTLERYVDFVLSQIKSGESFTESMKTAVSGVLASPRFLYLFDQAGVTAKVEQLDDFELASRLSFFLWGSIPDQTLLKLAAERKLRDPKVLNGQLDRMLNDRRMKRFCDNFPTQWLQLDRIISSLPNRKRFKGFYFGKYMASMHMALEPLLVFETIYVENRSIIELIDPKFTYRSRLLETWFAKGRGNSGSPVVIPFRRVPIKDRRQGGVITNAAVMTMTSGPGRTKPITRGAWISTVIFNNPPKPPPADVPPLPEANTPDSAKMTLRERLELHRKREDCRGCHAKIDPLGFALENYGPTGVWRDRYENGRKVDSGGVLFNKHKFSTPVEFKNAILAEKDRFTRAFAKHLLSYALGRELEPADDPAVAKIVRRTIAAKYRMRPMIKYVILSRPFLHKYNPRKESE